MCGHLLGEKEEAKERDGQCRDSGSLLARGRHGSLARWRRGARSHLTSTLLHSVSGNTHAYPRFITEPRLFARVEWSLVFLFF